MFNRAQPRKLPQYKSEEHARSSTSNVTPISNGGLLDLKAFRTQEIFIPLLSF